MIFVDSSKEFLSLQLNGTDISFRLIHLANALFPISVRASGRIIFVKELHP
jgi:hypothetical protein